MAGEVSFGRKHVRRSGRNAAVDTLRFADSSASYGMNHVRRGMPIYVAEKIYARGVRRQRWHPHRRRLDVRLLALTNDHVALNSSARVKILLHLLSCEAGMQI